MKFLDLPIYPAEWPELWRERYEERSAVMEFGANMAREVAERNAEADTRWQLNQDGRNRAPLRVWAALARPANAVRARSSQTR
jgi:hypothetical protein